MFAWFLRGQSCPHWLLGDLELLGIEIEKVADPSSIVVAVRISVHIESKSGKIAIFGSIAVKDKMLAHIGFWESKFPQKSGRSQLGTPVEPDIDHWNIDGARDDIIIEHAYGAQIDEDDVFSLFRWQFDDSVDFVLDHHRRKKVLISGDLIPSITGCKSELGLSFCFFYFRIKLHLCDFGIAPLLLLLLLEKLMVCWCWRR